MIINNENELYERIKEKTRIYIYGAGHYGRLAAKRLAKKGVIIAGFCVTQGACHSEKVFEISEISADATASYIVAVGPVFRQEMENELKKYGITDYLILSDKLLLTMERIDGKRLRFQTHLAEHCNLKCRGCYHFSPLAKEEYLSIDEYESDVKRLSELFDGRMEEILLLGGEPLLHPDVNAFLDISRKYFPEGNIKILTNGLLLNTIDDSFYLSMKMNKAQLWVTKYPVAFDYDRAEKRAASFGLEIFYFQKEPVRVMGYQPLELSGCHDAKTNFYGCYRADECVDLKHGRLYPCILPAEIGPFRDYFGVDINRCSEDSVSIYEVKSGEELLEAMEKPIPFCRYCDRSDVAISGRIPWSQSQYSIEEWIK